jgi:cell wall-associated NlpC family hydrolase
MYLREGLDAVYHGGAYYMYAKGQWHVSEGDQGPWRAVETADEGEAPPVTRAQPQTGSSPERSSPPRTDQAATPSAGPTTGDHVARVALRYLGSPYRWGGSGPRGFDCSGFAMYVYAKFGVLLPHNAAKQYRRGTPVARDQLRPGDLVFFDRLRHNGIYIGDGQFVHSNKRGGGVRVSGLDESWFRERWTGARRLLSAQPAGGEEVMPAVSEERGSSLAADRRDRIDEVRGIRGMR